MPNLPSVGPILTDLPTQGGDQVSMLNQSENKLEAVVINFVG